MRIFLLLACHGVIVSGCFFVAWGMFFPLHGSSPLRILAHSLFWGFFVSLLGYAESGILSVAAFWIGMG
jgi:hypothetical protein